MPRVHLKPPELLGTPNVEPRAISSQAPMRGRFNDHPRGVPPSGGKRGARKRDDMVCSAWRHAAVRKRTGAELASCVEQKVKRAAFKWGSGRELYTSPTIWVSRDKCRRIQQGKNGREQCYDDFRVTEIDVEDGQIVNLVICNMSNRGDVVYGNASSQEPAKDPSKDAWEQVRREVWAWCKRHGCADEENFRAKLNGIQARPEWESQHKSLEWLAAVANEFHNG